MPLPDAGCAALSARWSATISRTRTPGAEWGLSGTRLHCRAFPHRIAGSRASYNGYYLSFPS
ncbi:hypothetical protein CBM2591_A240057 [Cupriavidus taiwanensis]|nr:hypothetical protein CBM2591_A240057 [Cupriavidus taiwanensis]